MKPEILKFSRHYKLADDEVWLGMESTVAENEDLLEAFKGMETLCDHYFQTGRYMKTPTPPPTQPKPIGQGVIRAAPAGPEPPTCSHLNKWTSPHLRHMPERNQKEDHQNIMQQEMKRRTRNQE